MTLTQRAVTGLVLLATGAAVATAFLVIRESREPILPPPVPRIRPADLLFDMTPVSVRTTVDWQKVFITVPRWQFLRDHTIWLRMQFEDWDVLPADTRASGLQQLLLRYGPLATDRHAWRAMTADDWDG